MDRHCPITGADKCSTMAMVPNPPGKALETPTTKESSTQAACTDAPNTGARDANSDNEEQPKAKVEAGKYKLTVPAATKDTHPMATGVGAGAGAEAKAPSVMGTQVDPPVNEDTTNITAYTTSARPTTAVGKTDPTAQAKPEWPSTQCDPTNRGALLEEEE